jgi:hypothetical protein
MFAFELLQLAHQLIEVKIGDDRLIQDIVAVFVFTDLLAEVFDMRSDGLVHGEE